MTFPRLLLLAVAFSFALASPSHAVIVAGGPQISEFQPDPAGGDPTNQTIELFGTPGTSYMGFLSTIETDDIAARGTIDRQTAVNGMFDVNGFATESVPDLENPSFTLVFHSASGGGEGTNLDANDDDSLDDITVLGTIFDAVSIPNAAADSGIYAGQLGGVDFNITGTGIDLAFRDANTGTWYAARSATTVFDSAGNNVISNGMFSADPTATTFGLANPIFTPVPEPTAAALMLFGLVTVFQRRRPTA